MKFNFLKYHFSFWVAKDRPQRFRYTNLKQLNNQGAKYSGQTYQPFFWIYITCWSGDYGLPFIGEKISKSGKTYKVLRCPTSIQGNIGRLMFWISCRELTTCHINPIILKRIDV